ncbi:MAG TPA: tetratricopeptide repeat-containing sensor histidine kinase [Bryobacteraceae bacterium]|nr:tetratricopeptide repeat-containing sensor histidine kinase [Bryobacteraceae bacterium]
MAFPLEKMAELEEELDAIGPEPTRQRVAALNSLAYSLTGYEQWDRMQALASEAASIASTIGDKAGEGRATGILAFVQYIRSDFKAALASCMRGLTLLHGDPQGEARIRVILGMVQWTLGNFDEALRHVERALPVLREFKDSSTEAFAMAAKGGILHSLGQYDLAVACYRDSLELFRDTGFKVGVARALSGLGSAYQALGLVAAALECHKDSLEIAEKAGHSIALSRALTDLGQVYESQHRFDDALDCHRRALAMREQEKYLQPQTTNLFHIGSILHNMGDTERALENLHRGLAISEEIGARPKLGDFHQVLSDIYEKTGDLRSALHHYKAYEKIKAEIFSDQATLRHKALELESQLEIHRLRNVELAELLEQLQITQAELLNREKMAALGSLVAALAHEINSPLGVIQSSSDLTLRCADRIAGTADPRAAIEALRTNARLIKDASQRIGKLVMSLKSFAQLDRAEFGDFDVLQSLDHILALLEPEFRGRVEVVRDLQPVPIINVYGAELNQVFMNLLRNAAQAIEGNGSITLQTRADDASIRIVVKDTGRGIPTELCDAIFNPSFNREGDRVRASLSLFGCLNIARKHGGDIAVDSKVGHGSTFTVILPRSLENAPEPVRAA